MHVDWTGCTAPGETRLSIDAGIPVVDLDLAGVALYAPTETGLEHDFGSAEAALAAGAELVVVTKEREAAPRTQRRARGAGDVDPGSCQHPRAGDVFHGALLAALVWEQPLAEALALANRAAALSCRALDGRSAIPTLAELA